MAIEAAGIWGWRGQRWNTRALAAFTTSDRMLAIA